jgi:acyl-CoA reductase-like NAD-dependent aldehyde dehydrogenase
VKTKTGILSLVILAATVGYLIIPAAVKAADSAEVTKLLADAKAAAVELNADSADMEQYTRSKLSWKSYAHKLEMIRGHVNDTGRLLAKLKDAEASGSPWQQATIKRIEPLLQEIADNTTATLKHLNDNQAGVHLPAFRDLVKANHELTADLEALIRDSVNYGKAKEKFEGLEASQ